MALALESRAPDWRSRRILECSPSARAISLKIRGECLSYTAINYFAEVPPGSIVNGAQNEDLQALSFPDASFDLFVALDVLEHIPRPDQAIREIRRVLEPGGLAILTFPIRKQQTSPTLPRAYVASDGSITHITEPEFHGNPFSDDGSLVFTDFGYEFHLWASQQASMDVEVTRFADWTHGVLGEYTEVCVMTANTSWAGREHGSLDSTANKTYTTSYGAIR